MHTPTTHIHTTICTSPSTHWSYWSTRPHHHWGTTKWITQHTPHIHNPWSSTSDDHTHVHIAQAVVKASPHKNTLQTIASGDSCSVQMTELLPVTNQAASLTGEHDPTIDQRREREVANSYPHTNHQQTEQTLAALQMSGEFTSYRAGVEVLSPHVTLSLENRPNFIGLDESSISPHPIQ